MLLEKTSFGEGDIVTVKLTSGEEIIGKYISGTDDQIVLEKVLMLAMSQNGVGMAPYLITVNPDNKLRFNKSLIVVVAETDKEIANQYTYQTTGIQPVRSGGIVV